MAARIPLGAFEPVTLRDAWPTEDGDFTPWLAEVSSIALLGKALNMELEVEGIEQNVGSFRADIVARAIDEPGHRVVIENQFGRTDHVHLGQVLTYLAGIEEAKTIVWIAERIQPDHRAAIDWLNAHTSEEFSFFAIEIELWRIGDSPPAPRFNVIASPNDWTRNTRAATRQIGGTLAESHHLRLAYWASFADYLKEHSSSLRINRPNKDAWKSFAIGRTDFAIDASISTAKQRIGVELYIDNDLDSAAFRALLGEKDVIEVEFGETLEWQELPGKKATRIVLYRHGVDPSDEKQYSALHAWMLDKIERFRRTFATRVKALPLNSRVKSAPDDEPPDDRSVFGGGRHRSFYDPARS
jgi:hypothetical protein